MMINDHERQPLFAALCQKRRSVPLCRIIPKGAVVPQTGWVDCYSCNTMLYRAHRVPPRAGWVDRYHLCCVFFPLFVRHTPHGVGGLKFSDDLLVKYRVSSHPARGGWSEMLYVPSVSFVIARRGRAPDRSETRGQRRPAGALCSSAAFRQRFSILHNRSLAAPRSSAMSWLFLLRADLSAILPASLPVCKAGLPPHVFQNSSSGGIRINPHCLQTIAMY